MDTVVSSRPDQPGHVRTEGWAAPLTVLFFIVFLHADAHEGDLLYWASWAGELVTGGYSSLEANYPPLLLHWLWMTGKIFTFLGLVFPPGSDLALKFFVLLPVLGVQVWLSRRVECNLLSRNVDPLKSPVFWGVVANPAILLDGPVWGQVDLLPFMPLWLCLFYTYEKHFFFAGIAFAVALMCKFQVIVFVPLLAGLLLKDWRKTPQVIAGVLLAGFFGFLPFIVHGRLLEQLALAYWGNMDIYPYATFNAANLWYYLVGNMTDMHVPVFGEQAGVLSAFTPHRIGLGLFSAVSALVMYRAWRYSISQSELVQLGIVLLLCFFAFAPSMHERYLFLLVPFTALACASGYISGSWFAVATVLVSLNILLVLPLEGEHLWVIQSWIVAIVAIVALLQFGYKQSFSIPDMRRLSMPVTLAMVTFYGGFHLYQLHHLNVASFDEQGRSYLSDILWVSGYQEWGRPRRDANTTEGKISIYGKTFEKGLGVHANSSLVFRIPAGARYFHAYYGMDEKGKQGQVSFKVKLDGQQVWSSGAVRYDMPGEVWIPLDSATEIALDVDSLGSNHADHANWAEAGFWHDRPKSDIQPVK